MNSSGQGLSFSLLFSGERLAFRGGFDPFSSSHNSLPPPFPSIYILKLDSIFLQLYTATSTLLVTGSADNQMRLWEVSTGKCLFVWEFTTAAKRVSFNSTGSQVLVVTEERMGYKGTIRVFSINQDQESWTNQSKEPLRTITFSGPKATVATWSAEDEYIITGHVDGKVAKYYHDKQEPETGIDAELEELMGKYTETGESITDLQMSEDKTYFVTSSKDKTSRVSWERDLVHFDCLFSLCSKVRDEECRESRLVISSRWFAFMPLELLTFFRSLSVEYFTVFVEMSTLANSSSFSLFSLS